MSSKRASVAFLWVGCVLGGCGDSADSSTTTSNGSSTGDTSSSMATSGGAGGTSAQGTGSNTTATGSASAGGAGGQGPVNPACSVEVPRTVPLQAWAEPDAGQTPFVDALTTAKSSIRVMVYEMGYGDILTTLEAKAKSGVSVKVILDLSEQSVNQKYFDALTQAGASVEWSDPQFSYMHAKAMVIDDSIAVISTGNYLASQMAKERNYVTRDEDPADVASLASLFDADFARQSPDLSCTRLIVSPVNSRDRLLALIKSATTTLDIESMQFADTDVRSAVVARKNAGVTVRVLIGDPSWITANTDAATYLAGNGITARYMTTPMVHVKAISVDGARSYLGSENLSYTSLNKNREVGVIAYEAEIQTLMKTTFETDWATATAFQ